MIKSNNLVLQLQILGLLLDNIQSQPHLKGADALLFASKLTFQGYFGSNFTRLMVKKFRFEISCQRMKVLNFSSQCGL